MHAKLLDAMVLDQTLHGIYDSSSIAVIVNLEEEVHIGRGEVIHCEEPCFCDCQVRRLGLQQTQEDALTCPFCSLCSVCSYILLQEGFLPILLQSRVCLLNRFAHASRMVEFNLLE